MITTFTITVQQRHAICQEGDPVGLHVCLQGCMHMLKFICMFLHILPAAAQRQPAVLRLCSSPCKPGSTQAVVGTSGGRSARRTS